MKSKVGIGMTTYRDIRSPDFGYALYEALVATSPKLAPYRVDVIAEKYDVRGPQDFAAHWCSERRLVVRPRYGVAPSYAAPSDFGAKWRVKGPLSGGGDVFFDDTDPNGPSTLSMIHNHATRLDWRLLFRQLVDIFRPRRRTCTSSPTASWSSPAKAVSPSAIRSPERGHSPNGSQIPATGVGQTRGMSPRGGGIVFCPNSHGETILETNFRADMIGHCC